MSNYRVAIRYIMDHVYSAYEISRETDDMFGGKGKGVSELAVKNILDGKTETPHRTTRDKLIEFVAREMESESNRTEPQLDTKDLNTVAMFIVDNEKSLDNIKLFRLWKDNLVKDEAIRILRETLTKESFDEKL